MKKIIFSSVAIVTVAVVAGIGSYAMWSDTETSNGNRITAGSMDLIVSVDSPDSIPITIADVYPTYSKTITGTVENAGTIDGTLKMELTNLSQREVSLVEPESEVGDNWDEHADGTGNGELCYALMASVNGSPFMHVVNGELEIPDVLTAGEIYDYSVEIMVAEDAGNDIMTDNCTFDVTTTLDQVVEI